MSDLDQYDYELPREMIAQKPLGRRSDARLMVVRRDDGRIHHAHVRDLLDYATERDCLVFNDTRVLPARLVGYRARTRGRWSGLFLSANSQGQWQVMCKTRGRLKPGEQIVLQDRDAQDRFCLVMLAHLGEGVWAAQPDVDHSHVELLESVGRVPLPPYIRGGEMEEQDIDSYQTVFASAQGAIAAPTAGLHFTPELLQQLVAAGVSIARVTLHVGMGTFRPISVTALDAHRMHGEWCAIDTTTVEQLCGCRRQGGRIIAVGTTVVRALETAAANGQLRPWEGVTDLFIRPPYSFRAVDAMMTNFHLPKSTLLILVRAFGGDDLIRRAYQVAVHDGYRFYSYGDAMLIE